jgi:hypothetical protein
MELDHTFFLVNSQNAAEDAVARLGLTETYRRQHPGQGTSNICCCFDNAFIEFLWVENPTEASSNPAHRLGLIERSQLGNCPFGISWRGASAFRSPSVWRYTPSYLPADVSIDVLDDHSNYQLPVIFQSPGIAGPITWPEEKRKNLQHKKGFGRIAKVILTVPHSLIEHENCKWLNASELILVSDDPENQFTLTFEVENRNGERAATIRLPSLSIITH